MARLPLLLVSALLSLPLLAHAQSEISPVIARSVAAAEEEGAMTRRVAGDSARIKLLASPLGSERRTCAEVQPSAFANDWSAARSTGATLVRVRAGDFALSLTGARIIAGQEVKMPWIPLHDPLWSVRKILIRAARIDPSAQPGDTLRIKPERHSGLDFFPSSFTFPSPGTWLIVANADPDWGCLILPVAG